MPPRRLAHRAGALLLALAPCARAERTELRISAPESTDVWVLATAGLGAGAKRLGPVATSAGLDADVFWGRVGVGASAGVLASGEPDGNGSEGSLVAGRLAYRLRLGSSAPGSADWGFATVGLGWGGLAGYERTDGEKRDFDFSGVVAPAGIGVLFQRQVFAYGIDLKALLVPTQGYSLVLAFDVGVALGAGGSPSSTSLTLRPIALAALGRFAPFKAKPE